MYQTSLCGQCKAPLDTSPGLIAVLTTLHLTARRYRVLSLLGEGGMGAAFLAADQDMGQRRVALKVRAYVPDILCLSVSHYIY